MNKKKLLWLCCGIIVILVLGSISIMLSNKDNKNEEPDKPIVKELEYKESITINVGDDIPLINDYVTSEEMIDSDIKWNNLDTTTSKVYYAGEYEGIITYNNEEFVIKLVVVDNEAPIINNVKDITIYEGENIDLLKDIKVSDNSHDEIKTIIKGEYNIEKSGTYSLSYEASDNSGNITTNDFKLIVKEKIVVTSNKNSNTNSNNKGTSIVGKTTKGYEIKKIDGIYYIKGILIANKTYDLPSNYAPGSLLSEFTIAFTKMKEDAKKDGITLTIVSGYRSYSKQKSLYNRYVARDGKAEADTYSARPGHSEHQTGLAADLNLVDSSFANTEAGKWLANNCYKYGFILRYPKGKESYTGYMYEPWHFRFIGDEAVNLYNNGSWISLEEYLGIDSKY